MDELNAILRDATAAVGPHYFLLPIDGADAKYRERVYCYELYHQMRSRWPPGCRYSLNGEIDKRLHPYFQGRNPRSPDLLVHVPGVRDNHAIIEVKPFFASTAGIRKDIATLLLFKRRFGYQRAIQLVYGATAADVRARWNRCARAGTLARIELVAHSQAGLPAEVA